MVMRNSIPIESPGKEVEWLLACGCPLEELAFGTSLIFIDGIPFELNVVDEIQAEAARMLIERDKERTEGIQFNEWDCCLN